MSVIDRILFSRLLTRIGDQAWDFAVPLALVTRAPGGLRTAAIFSLGRGIGMMLLMPRLGRLIDRWPRLRTARLATVLQAVGVGLAAILLGIPSLGLGGSLWLLGVVACGLTAALGAALMEIAVASDLVPAVVPAHDLTRINSRLKQIDLATEVGVPVVAGLILALRPASLPTLGFLLVALANVVSFYPEYWLLASALGLRPELNSPVPTVTAIGQSLVARLSEGWRAFLAQPARASMLADACLWFTVLSPHGTLLTGFLKEGWHLSETSLGIFRGLGALFGLTATAIFPRLVRRRGLIQSARLMIFLEALAVIAALLAFLRVEPWLFLGALLVSRIGLYGFMLGEAEIRQRTIPAGQRGRVNGVFAAVTSFSSLTLAGISTAFATPEGFWVLVAASAAAVSFGALLFTAWTLGKGRRLASLNTI